MFVHKHQMNQVFRPWISKDKGFQLYKNECPMVDSTHWRYVPDDSQRNQSLKMKPGMCLKQSTPLRSDIEMEKEWSAISVGYPQYVYTVSGWTQLIHVPNYNIKPLQVFIVPHSHQDPGWKDTYEGYYNSYTRQVLDYMVKFLESNPTWKFIWSEISYLEKWFSSPDSDKEQLKKLVASGQLEIVTGGWVMTDEAVAHYSSMLDQLIEGHLWVYNNLGIVPNTSWSVDPFGHSPTMAYLLKQAGIQKMVIQRTHFGIKRHFAKKQNLEFSWRQAWDSDGQTGIFCHMMPFLLYAIHYSCGPDPHVCCQFDFSSDKCFRGTNSVPKITVDDSNIRKLSWALWEQYQKKAQLYRSNVLLVPHGDDFRYSSSKEWSQQFDNLGRLIDYMNKDKDMNIKVQYGTISDYFNALDKDSEQSKLTYPTLTGDFFPYNDRDDQYWTGYFSVRPLYKHVARVLQAKLRITEILFSLTMAQSQISARQLYKPHAHVLVDARRSLGLFHHHDAITGTSKKFVMADYGRILRQVMDKLNKLLAFLMLNNMVFDNNKYAGLTQHSVSMTEEWYSTSSPPVLKVIYYNRSCFVTVTNPLTIPWTSAVTVRVSTPSRVRVYHGSFVPSQINPVIGKGMQPVSDIYDIVFIANLAALSVKLFELVEDAQAATFASVTILGNQLATSLFLSKFHPTTSTKPRIEIENQYLKASFSSCTGTLQHTLRKTDGILHQTEVKMVSYGTGSWINPFRDKSGAYIFMPDGEAQDVESFYPNMLVFRGPVMSAVMSHLPGVLHTSTLYNIPGPMGTGVHIDNLVDISSEEWANKELAMRIITDVVSPDTSLCVDLNGYQMHRKKWRAKFLIQGNFHPMTSMAYLTDDKLSRVTLITSEAHGVASLKDGMLEVMLDRRLMQDDWRGLNEGAHDNVPSPSRFILLPERRDTISLAKEQACYPSLLAHLLSSHLSNPPQVAVITNINHTFRPETTFLQGFWPCTYHLLNIRSLGLEATNQQALILLHRVGLDCSYHQAYQDCNVNNTLHLKSFTNIDMLNATVTSLTGVKEITLLPELALDLKNMEIKTIKVTYR
ncbi:hypothetical protein BsWGS_11009 [Bradybaena similaris]